MGRKKVTVFGEESGWVGVMELDSDGMWVTVNRRKQASPSDDFFKKRRKKKKFDREDYLMYHYNMTKADYQEMLDSQNGCCAICGTHIDDLDIKLNVDHCHSTGKVRGLLCMQCNHGLGNFKDDVELFKSAILYLEKSRENEG